MSFQKDLRSSEFIMKYKNLIIYGGTSEISLHLIKLYANECSKFIVFCRSKDSFFDFFKHQNFEIDLNKFTIFETDLLEINKNLEIIKQFESQSSGIFWIAGMTGNAENEYLDIDSAKKNMEINFIHPTLLLNEISKKLIKNNNSFIAVITSVAGLRGRKKQLFYSPSKAALMSYLSGLRQKLYKDKILVTTIIPGYMNTKPFRNGEWSAPKFLITEPRVVAYKIKKGIEKNQEIIFINYWWKIIMIIVKFIPEKIFKRLSF